MKTYSKSPGEEALKGVACAICGARDGRRLSGAASLWVKCSGCGLVYQEPQPVQAELLERYDGEYFDYEIENEEAFFKLMQLGLADIDFESLERTTGPERSFLDVGCATGKLIEWMKQRGWQEQGVEVCVPAAEYGEKTRNVRIFPGVLEDARFDTGSFDVVHCSHLIEHLNDPAGYVQEVRRILKPGGYFIVTTPNIAGLQARFFRDEWRSMIPDHLYLFSVATLTALLQRAGFTVMRHKTWGGFGVGSVPNWVKRPADRLAKRFGFGDVVILVARVSATKLGAV